MVFQLWNCIDGLLFVHNLDLMALSTKAIKRRWWSPIHIHSNPDIYILILKQFTASVMTEAADWWVLKPSRKAFGSCSRFPDFIFCSSCVCSSPNWGSASFNDKCQLTFMGAESNVAKIFFLSNVRNVPKSYIYIMKRFTPSFGAWFSFPEIAYLFGNNSKVWDNLDESWEPAHFSQYSCAAQIQSVAFLGQNYKIHRSPSLYYEKLFLPKAEFKNTNFRGKKWHSMIASVPAPSSPPA